MVKFWVRGTVGGQTNENETSRVRLPDSFSNKSDVIIVRAVECFNIGRTFFLFKARFLCLLFKQGDLHLQDLVVSQLNYLLAADFWVILAVGVSLRTADNSLLGDSGQWDVLKPCWDCLHLLGFLSYVATPRTVTYNPLPGEDISSVNLLRTGTEIWKP